MASSLPAIQKQEAATLIRQVQYTQLFNRQLSSICQVNGLKCTGVKAELQRRIINLIQEAINHDDLSTFRQIERSVLNAIGHQTSSPSKPALNPRNPGTLSQNGAPAQHPFMTNYNMPTAYSNGYHHAVGVSNGPRATGYYQQSSRVNTIPFKSSPFYEIESSFGSYRICEVMSQHRNSVTVPLRLDEATCQKLINNKSLRIMVFCATDVTHPQDIAFPHQSELKVNGGDIKANLRGLKNKPGSTRPVDITDAIRLRPANYHNNVEFTYALTNKKYYVIVNLCKAASVPDLVQAISTRRRIPKQSVITELNKKAQDPDVVATSQVLSLKCPLSYMRLVVPCRSLSCTHLQCFDATSYLQLQEQGPQWLCPICSKPAPFGQLAVDEYVKDILAKTSHSLETVTIAPNGEWSTKQDGKSDHSTARADLKREVDDDDLELSEISFATGTRSTPRDSVSHLGFSTPAQTSSDAARSSAPNSGPRGLGSVSSKRPPPTVIDLTLSSDEEDEPVSRPGKRNRVALEGDDDDDPSVPAAKRLYERPNGVMANGLGDGLPSPYAL